MSAGRATESGASARPGFDPVVARRVIGPVLAVLGEQPVHRDRDRVQHRDVAIARPQPQLGGGEVAEEPLGVTRRDHPVFAAMDEPHRGPDGREVDAPGRDEGEVVVDEALGRRVAGSPGVGAQGAPRSLERRPVGRREAVRVELVGLREALAFRAAALGGDESSRGDHPGVPLGTWRERRWAAQRHGGDDAVRQRRGAGERVRPPAGCAHDREPVDARGIHQLRHVRAADPTVRPRLGLDPP